MKKQEGITMVSLVITIIIVIILAGISINLTVGDNGIITKSKQAKENIQIAQKEEREQLNLLYEQLGNYDEEVPPDMGAIEDLENKLQDLQNKFNNLQTEFNNFKAIIADAITEKGVATDPADTADMMAENIKKLGGMSGYKRIYPGSPYTVTKDGTVFVVCSGNNQYASTTLTGCSYITVSFITDTKNMSGNGQIGVAKKGNIVNFGTNMGGGDWHFAGTCVLEPTD